jgi:hypothetical protein
MIAHRAHARAMAAPSDRRLVTSGRAPSAVGEPRLGASGRDDDDDNGAEGSASSASTLEFAYAFDVHCNSYFPLFLLLHVAQYLALPLLLGNSHASGLLSVMLYLAAVCEYTYVTFLGYNGEQGQGGRRGRTALCVPRCSTGCTTVS